MSVPCAAGKLYDVDVRLRPQGGQGPLVVTVDSFERYQREEAWTWEHMALLRARAVYGTDTARDDQRIGRARAQPHAIGEAPLADPVADDLGRASCRERVCPYVSITGVAVFFK